MVATTICELNVGEDKFKKLLGFMLKFLAQIWPPNFFTGHL